MPCLRDFFINLLTLPMRVQCCFKKESHKHMPFCYFYHLPWFPWISRILFFLSKLNNLWRPLKYIISVPEHAGNHVMLDYWAMDFWDIGICRSHDRNERTISVILIYLFICLFIYCFEKGLYWSHLSDSVAWKAEVLRPPSWDWLLYCSSCCFWSFWSVVQLLLWP